MGPGYVLPKNPFLFTLLPGAVEALPQAIALAFHPSGVFLPNERLEWVCNKEGYIYNVEFIGEGTTQRAFKGSRRIDIEKTHEVDDREKRRRVNDFTHPWDE